MQAPQAGECEPPDDDIDDGWNCDDPGYGTCARCGCNLDASESAYDLCDQCEWWSEQSGRDW